MLLATLEVPFDRDAMAFAVDAAIESGQPLMVVNVVRLPWMPLSVAMGYDQAADPPDLVDALVAPARLAHGFGVDVERLRVRSPHPVQALLEVVVERRPGLLVFGPERSKLRRRTYARAAARIRAEAHCLVWLADD